MLMNSINSAASVRYPPAATLRVVEALQKANKDFEMVLPGGFSYNNYMFRDCDFLSEHLIGETPPTDISFDDILM